MKTATLLKGTVKFKAGAPKQTKDGRLRLNIVVTLPTGEEVKIWGNPDDPIAYLSKGAEIQLLHDGEDYALLQTADQIPQPQPQAQPLALPPSPAALAISTPATRITCTPSMSADVQEWLSIFTELEQARPDLKEETRRAAASTLFMQRCKMGDA